MLSVVLSCLVLPCLAMSSLVLSDVVFSCLCLAFVLSSPVFVRVVDFLLLLALHRSLQFSEEIERKGGTEKRNERQGKAQ